MICIQRKLHLTDKKITLFHSGAGSRDSRQQVDIPQLAVLPKPVPHGGCQAHRAGNRPAHFPDSPLACTVCINSMIRQHNFRSVTVDGTVCHRTNGCGQRSGCQCIPGMTTTTPVPPYTVFTVAQTVIHVVIQIQQIFAQRQRVATLTAGLSENQFTGGITGYQDASVSRGPCQRICHGF
ncbi:hypothetical protein BvCmsKSP076_01138 [Escherichia coli]|nr:hypothetical protein BvCmsKSP014_05249 [Escherichia coli]GDN75457.1 hypothetical protein BvCmsKSP076_01138 [Escherichia coli]GDU98703.1 hypothetical protein BvCmsSIP042_05881 [Escherichia coli]